MVQPRSQQISLLQAYWSVTSYTSTPGASSDSIAAATLNAASVTGVSGGDTGVPPVRGIVTNTPDNLVRIRNSADGYAVLDDADAPIFGRLTFAAGFYIITYLKLLAGVETTITLPAGTGDFDLLFPEVMLFGEMPTNSVLNDYGGFVFSAGSGGGSQPLSATLAIGNTTGGNDIELTGTNAITSDSSLVNINDNLNVAGDATINGKLTVTGLIDPTGLVLDEQAANPYDPTATAKATLWVKNDNPNILLFTDNAGTNHDLIKKDITLSGTISTAGVITDNLAVYSMIDGTAATIEILVTGRKDDGTQACGFKLIGTFRRSGVTVTAVGSVAAVFYESDDPTWTADLVINSTNIEVQVTGGVGDNVDWKGVGSVVLNEDV